MSRRTRVVGAAASAAVLTLALVVTPSSSALADTENQTEYTVVAGENVSVADATAAITQAGGTVVSSTTDVGMFHVVSSDTNFAAKAEAAPQLVGAVHKQVIGFAPNKPSTVEKEQILAASAAAARKPKVGADPLDNLLWGMEMIQAPAGPRGRGRRQEGHRRHPRHRHRRHATRTSRRTSTGALSRNFATDMPDDRRRRVRSPSCVDPVGTRRRRPRHARRRHDRRGGQRHRRLRRRARTSRWSSSGAARTRGFFFLEPVVNALDLRRRRRPSTWSTCRSTSTRGCTTARRNPADTPEPRRPSSGRSSRR